MLEVLDAEAQVASGRSYAFRAGDVIDVRMVVPENGRKVATIRGVCIARRSRGMGSSFTIIQIVPGMEVLVSGARGARLFLGDAWRGVGDPQDRPTRRPLAFRPPRPACLLNAGRAASPPPPFSTAPPSSYLAPPPSQAERIIPLYSPNLVGIDLVRAGNYRRYKMYWLKERPEAEIRGYILGRGL